MRSHSGNDNSKTPQQELSTARERGCPREKETERSTSESTASRELKSELVRNEANTKNSIKPEAKKSGLCV